jgi:hypothetical protein
MLMIFFFCLSSGLSITSSKLQLLILRLSSSKSLFALRFSTLNWKGYCLRLCCLFKNYKFCFAAAATTTIVTCVK